MQENQKGNVFSINQIPEPHDINEVIYSLMVNPNLAPVNYFNEFSDDAIDPENVVSKDTDGAGIFEVDGLNGPFAMTTHAMHKHLETDPQKATEILISKAVRKMLCFGARPISVSAFLYHINVADPNGQFISEGAKVGVENAAKAFGLKVSDRKVRFDNINDRVTVPPTIIISMLGKFDAEKPILTPDFKNKGNNIFVIGKNVDDIAASEYLEFYHEVHESSLPAFALSREQQIHGVVRGLHQEGLIQSASPVGKGGLFFSLLRAGLPGDLGFDITTDAETRKDAFLFGEAMGRIIVGVNPEKEDDFLDYMRSSKLPFFTLGHVTKGEIRIDDESFGYVDKMEMNFEG
ncbi:hypothetical protein EMN47_14395 [Prolixibacteraceae bacterium JC049]|nr:hypothetical protein [Prolixibacteraceae bacterium JC049]